MLHSIGIIAVAAIVTLFIRAIPFVLFGGKREVPATVTYLGEVLPPAIMVILVVYCVKGIDLFTGNHGVAVCGSGCGTSYLEAEYFVEYSCWNDTIHDISASSILNQCERAIFRPFHTIFL